MKKVYFAAVLAICLSESRASANAQERYVVVKGDTLWDVAEMLYDDPFQWVKIYEANKDRIANPHLIHPEQLLVVIDKEGKRLILKVAAEDKEGTASREEIAVAKAVTPLGEEPEVAKASSAAKEEEMPQDPQEKALEEEEEEEPAAGTPMSQSGMLSRKFSRHDFKEYDGQVIVFADPTRHLVSRGDVVFVDLGEQDGLLPGDELLLVKKLRKVTDKKHKKKFWILENLGKLKVTSEIYPDRAACKVVFSHFPVNVGDGVLKAARGGQ